MSVIGIKHKDGKIEYFEETIFSEDKKENYLHKIIEKDPRLIFEEISDNSITLLGSKVTLPSGKETDLIFCDSLGDIFIVELKRDRSPREAIAQLLDYASSFASLNIKDFLDLIKKEIKDILTNFKDEIEESEFRDNLQNSLKSPQLLLVSYTITDDVIRIADFLRGKGLLINCVEFDYYKSSINGEEIFVPNAIDSEETKDIKIKDKSINPAGRIYLEFYSDIISRFKEKKPGVTDKNALPYPWMQVPIGYSNYHLEWAIEGKEPAKIISVCLDLENSDKEKNKKISDKLEQKKEIISGKVKGELYSKPRGDGWVRIKVTYPHQFKKTALTEDNKLKDWAVDTMIDFYESIKESNLFDDIIKDL